MRRPDVINNVLSLFLSPAYLEIGVNQGQTFLEVQAASKVAVDPSFAFDYRQHASGSVAFHEVTSDVYFGCANPGRVFDVIYLDGLHTFSQIVRDLVNALSCLRDGGVIVIDDVLPNSYHASLPDEGLAARIRERFMPGSQDYSWMGDVYKVVYFVKDFVAQYSYATVADNHGQLVVWRQPRTVEDARSLKGVAESEFDSVISREDDFNVMPMAEIIERLKRRH